MYLLILYSWRSVFWEQQGLQLGKHTIQLSRSAAATQPAVERHFRELVKLYGKQHIVNLLGQKEGSAELILTDAYTQHVKNLDMGDLVRMTHYDFHAMVKGNQFENLESLVNMLRPSIKEYGFFLVNQKTGQIVSTQQGTFRVNCLDCLDRYVAEITVLVHRRLLTLPYPFKYKCRPGSSIQRSATILCRIGTQDDTGIHVQHLFE